ncbi:MAG: haloacid dehalogenase type II [Burkholderiales bacterium]|nr:haloacid dehalogenase type II [Burkholderiales bacterium]
MSAQIKALVFDAYGTLFDVHSVIRLCDELWPGKGSALSQLWRAKQLEYSWQRSLMQRYEDFTRVTDAGLRYACKALGLPLDDARRARLMDAYLHLEPYPEVRDALERLAGRKLAILSNGSPAMLEPVVANAGLARTLDAVISVDGLRIYKPDPRVYALAVEKLGVPTGAIGFVSSNCWDALGAKSFGFRVFWCNRAAMPVDELGVAPDHELRSLAELPALIDAA